MMVFSVQKLKVTRDNLVPFEESKIGFTVGGPLVRDKAFFFISAERYDDVDVDPFGPLGSGAPSELGFLRASDYNRIIDIAKNKYGFDPGGIGGALDSYDNKFLARFDVEADENNSLSLTFNYNDGLITKLLIHLQVNLNSISTSMKEVMK